MMEFGFGEFVLRMMPGKLTLQTAAAFERVYDALMGKTDDNLESLTLHLKALLRKANEIHDVTAALNHTDDF
jgi:hypothetical protein